MEAILEFFVNNYLWFLIISLILIFGLIGYIVDSYEKKAPKLHFNEDENVNMNISNVNDGRSLKEMIKENEENSNAKITELVDDKTSVIPENIEDLNRENELPNE